MIPYYWAILKDQCWYSVFTPYKVTGSNLRYIDMCYILAFGRYISLNTNDAKAIKEITFSIFQVRLHKHMQYLLP